MMSQTEKNFAALMMFFLGACVLMALIIVGHSIVWGARMDKKLDEIDRNIDKIDELQREQAAKNAVRDAWMVDHQNKIMKQIVEKETEQ